MPGSDYADTADIADLARLPEFPACFTLAAYRETLTLDGSKVLLDLDNTEYRKLVKTARSNQ